MSISNFYRSQQKLFSALSHFYRLIQHLQGWGGYDFDDWRLEEWLMWISLPLPPTHDQNQRRFKRTRLSQTDSQRKWDDTRWMAGSIFVRLSGMRGTDGLTKQLEAQRPSAPPTPHFFSDWHQKKTSRFISQTRATSAEGHWSYSFCAQISGWISLAYQNTNCVSSEEECVCFFFSLNVGDGRLRTSPPCSRRWEPGTAVCCWGWFAGCCRRWSRNQWPTGPVAYNSVWRCNCQRQNKSYNIVMFTSCCTFT